MKRIKTFRELRDALESGDVVHWVSVSWCVCRDGPTGAVVQSSARCITLGEAIMIDADGFFVTDDQDLQEARRDANPRA